MGGVDAEPVLGVGVGAQLPREPDPVPGRLAAAANHDKGVASLLEPPEDVDVLPEGLRGLLPGEEAPAETDGNDHGPFGFPRLRI